MIPAYNNTPYLRETLTSVLAQDPGPDQMQIEVVDDCSTDDPQAIVEELGPERIGFHRQPENVGHVRNFNTCIERARGHLVHLLHGDDAVRTGFYQLLQRPLEADTAIGAAFCRYIAIDAQGNWETIAALEPDGRGILENWLERIALGQRLQTPCMVVRRSVYEQLGGFDSRLQAEDWEMWTRIAAHFQVWYEPEPLALYRIHENSRTGPLRSAGANVADLRRVIAVNNDLLPPSRAATITKQALEITATTAIRRARRMLHAGDEASARAQVREALKTSRSPAVLERLVLFAALWLRHRASRSRWRRI
jgi:glycosyltransferase involved in cell wall biosynthesis